jgi:ABC-type transport system substrate-binding protein
VAQNSFAPYRTRWLKEQHPNRFELIEAPGVNVSYLAFNLRDPLLQDLRVRKALAMTIPVRSIIDHKLAGMAENASSFLAPFLPEAMLPAQSPGNLTENSEETRAKASTLLDQAGYPRSARTGIREGLRLTFKTTPIREGYEIVRILQDTWKKLGVSLKLEVVEPAVFLASIRKGAFQLSLGRWIGVADSSILERTLRSSSTNNRAGYKNPKMDLLLDQAAAAPTLEERKAVSQKVQNLMLEDLPYFPLWFWKNALIYDKNLEGLSAQQLSRSGGLMPLFDLRPKK